MLCANDVRQGRAAPLALPFWDRARTSHVEGRGRERLHLLLEARLLHRALLCPEHVPRFCHLTISGSLEASHFYSSHQQLSHQKKDKYKSAMATPSPSSALDMDNPEIDAREAFQGLTEAERRQHGG
jgi:hypothetical protein